MDNLLDLKVILKKYMSAIEVNRKDIILNNDSVQSDQNTIYCDIFPGVILAFFKFNSDFCIEDKINKSDVLEISYCIKGRFECKINNNAVLYVSEGDLSMNYIGHIQSESLFPLKLYEGISLYIDIKKFEGELKEILKILAINIEEISKKLKLNNEYYICKATSKIRSIFNEIHENRLDISYMRIKCIELIYSLNFLANRNIHNKKYYSREQISKIKHIRDYMIEHDDIRFSLEKLAKEHDISLTLFKNGFKRIYGDTPYSYIRKYKMNKASVLLKSSPNTNINDIAILLGYKNASKFSKAFKDVMGVTPREYKMNS